MQPQRFASYTLLRHLATGGMGELYLARRDGVAGFSKQVVVKRLRDDLALDEEFVEMFLDEGRLAAMLDHANIVHVYELGEANNSYFMAMEYVHGIDLGSLLGAVDGALDLTAALYIMRNICEGLAFAHDAAGMDGQPMHLVHRDINPQNILISEAGAVKITDFGIAKVAQRQHQTQAGILKGKFGYLSPEQARGQPVDRRCDIYALGLLLFEMTTGQSAVSSGTEAQMLEGAAHGMLRQPEEFVPTYPRALGNIFRRCTSYRPGDRFQNVPDLLDELVEFQMDARILATPKALVKLVSRHFGETFDAQRRALTPARSTPPA
ncbi:MAG: serine/threonine protein kinase, partial [Deltaproteobacteria bacterium]|nr:serine/threonine protein kinase [Deltaproteobacteria bacterium]